MIRLGFYTSPVMLSSDLSDVEIFTDSFINVSWYTTEREGGIVPRLCNLSRRRGQEQNLFLRPLRQRTDRPYQRRYARNHLPLRCPRAYLGAPESKITDFTSELSDSDEKLNKVKFTWRFAINRLRASPYETLGIFNDKFNPTYS